MSMTRHELLQAANNIVTADRNEQYGEPEDNFENIARLWSAYLNGSVTHEPECLGAEDVAIMMILFKVARLIDSNYNSMDSWVDIIGYAACGGEIASRGGAE